MNSKELGKQYNKIAKWWTSQMERSDYGMKYIQKAMSFAKGNSKVLDIGCGSTGRTVNMALKHGFDIIGMDVSTEMIRIAKKKHANVTFIHDDFIEWRTSDRFDLIIAWDSIFHAPKDYQKEITKKMCRLMNEGGILLFTAGSEAGEVSGEMEGVYFEYGSIGYWEYLTIIKEMNCKIVLMEEDQFPAGHMVFICKKKGV
jgi:ubiquinone/menaquinone biosynthesis C-methylase UbiE